MNSLAISWYISKLTIYFSAFGRFLAFPLKIHEKWGVFERKSWPNQGVSKPAFCQSTPGFFDLLLFSLFAAFCICTSGKKLIVRLLMPPTRIFLVSSHL